MRSLFVMDPLERINVRGDSTYVTMRECTDRGFPCAFCTPSDLYSHRGQARARVLPVRTTREAPFFHPEAAQDVALGDFDAVWMRKDPPFDMDYVFATYLLDQVHAPTVVINDPRGLKLFSEKMWVLERWPELQPETLVSNDIARLKEFVRSRDQRTVLKPWDGNGGRGVFVTDRTDRNLGSIAETLSGEGRRYVIAQAFVPEVEAGDKRILLFDGEPVGAMIRVPQPTDFRANMHAGGEVRPCGLGPRDLEICAAIGPALRESGMLFVGIDVIGSFLTEINVTSPTGIQEINRLSGTKLEADLVDRVFAKVGEGMMRRIGMAAMVGLLVGATPAPAPAPAAPKPASAPSTEPKPVGPEAPAASDGSADAGISQEILGKTPPPLPSTPRSPASPGYQPPVPGQPIPFRDLPYPQSTYAGAKYLQLDPAFVYGIQKGLEYVYLRRYSDARDYFGQVETAFPGTAARSIGDTLVWQSLMLENFDFKYDKQYWTSSKEAKKQLTAAIATPGAEGWDHLAMAAISGIESIHTMRQGNYVSALQLAFGAIDEIEKCRTAAPEFVDLKLADGLYNYWRTVITQGSKVLPDFGDHKTEGIEQMSVVQTQGVFMRPLASFGLAFTYLEEHDYHRATTACVHNRIAYPNNIVNNLTCGTIYTYDRNFPEALVVFDKVTAVDAANSRVHYLRGWTLLRSGDLEKSKSELTAYLGSAYLEPYQKSYALLRLGQVYAKQEDNAKAVESYTAAVKVDGNKEAKAALDRLEQKKGK